MSIETMTFYKPQYLLSQSSREQCLAKMKLIKSLTVGKQPEVLTAASVLIPLCVVNDSVNILYTLRSSNLKKYSGQISFPGGKNDANESAVDAAVRETEEELGISKNDIDVWGVGPTLPSRNYEMAVASVVGQILNYEKLILKPSEEEVKEVFTVPLQVLCDPKNQAHTQFKQGLIMPVFLYEGKKIWGLTAYLTHLFLSCLLPNDVYKNEFHKKRVDLSKL